MNITLLGFFFACVASCAATSVLLFDSVLWQLNPQYTIGEVSIDMTTVTGNNITVLWKRRVLAEGIDTVSEPEPGEYFYTFMRKRARTVLNRDDGVNAYFTSSVRFNAKKMRGKHIMVDVYVSPHSMVNTFFELVVPPAGILHTAPSLLEAVVAPPSVHRAKRNGDLIQHACAVKQHGLQTTWFERVRYLGDDVPAINLAHDVDFDQDKQSLSMQLDLTSVNRTTEYFDTLTGTSATDPSFRQSMSFWYLLLPESGVPYSEGPIINTFTACDDRNIVHPTFFFVQRVENCLRCTVSGWPAPTVQLFKDGLPMDEMELQSGDRLMRVTTFLNTVELLYIVDRPHAQHSGSYTCRAGDYLGRSAQETAHVIYVL